MSQDDELDSDARCELDAAPKGSESRQDGKLGLRREEREGCATAERHDTTWEVERDEHGGFVWSRVALPSNFSKSRREARKIARELESRLKSIDHRCSEHRGRIAQAMSTVGTGETDPTLVSLIESVAAMASAMKAEDKIYQDCFDEVIRQVSVQCRERGDLLAKIRFKYASMFQSLIHAFLGTMDSVEALQKKFLERHESQKLASVSALHVAESQLCIANQECKRLKGELLDAQHRFRAADDQVSILLQQRSNQQNRTRHTIGVQCSTSPVSQRNMRVQVSLSLGKAEPSPLAKSERCKTRNAAAQTEHLIEDEDNSMAEVRFRASRSKCDTLRGPAPRFPREVHMAALCIQLFFRRMQALQSARSRRMIRMGGMRHKSVQVGVDTKPGFESHMHAMALIGDIEVALTKESDSKRRSITQLRELVLGKSNRQNLENRALQAGPPVLGEMASLDAGSEATTSHVVENGLTASMTVESRRDLLQVMRERDQARRDLRLSQATVGKLEGSLQPLQQPLQQPEHLAEDADTDSSSEKDDEDDNVQFEAQKDTLRVSALEALETSMAEARPRSAPPFLFPNHSGKLTRLEELMEELRERIPSDTRQGRIRPIHWISQMAHQVFDLLEAWLCPEQLHDQPPQGNMPVPTNRVSSVKILNRFCELLGTPARLDPALFVALSSTNLRRSGNETTSRVCLAEVVVDLFTHTFGLPSLVYERLSDLVVTLGAWCERDGTVRLFKEFLDEVHSEEDLELVVSLRQALKLRRGVASEDVLQILRNVIDRFAPSIGIDAAEHAVVVIQLEEDFAALGYPSEIATLAQLTVASTADLKRRQEHLRRLQDLFLDLERKSAAAGMSGSINEEVFVATFAAMPWVKCKPRALRQIFLNSTKALGQHEMNFRAFVRASKNLVDDNRAVLSGKNGKSQTVDDQEEEALFWSLWSQFGEQIETAVEDADLMRTIGHNKLHLIWKARRLKGSLRFENLPGRELLVRLEELLLTLFQLRRGSSSAANRRDGGFGPLHHKRHFENLIDICLLGDEQWK
ncbi:unnamed protein product [Durusdinium trenchii]|uniref:MIF4G domain-containing protein n=1 Tax=Durusdinium trenchii TaxID=1381693 RepID=A0ABP0JTM1_9DINO